MKARRYGSCHFSGYGVYRELAETSASTRSFQRCCKFEAETWKPALSVSDIRKWLGMVAGGYYRAREPIDIRPGFLLFN